MFFSVPKNKMLNNQFEEDSTNPPFWGIQPPKAAEISTHFCGAEARRKVLSLGYKINGSPGADLSLAFHGVQAEAGRAGGTM